MVAPHFSACLMEQSDFGLSAGCSLGDAIVSDFSPKSCLWREVRQVPACDCRFASMLHLN
jgi:hypothetical protein